MHDFSDERRRTTLEFEDAIDGEVVVLFGPDPDDVRIDGDTLELEIDPYGYRWIRLGPSPAPRI